MANSIWLEFADGQYFFHLNAKMIIALEKKVDSHFGEIFARSVSGLYETNDGGWDINLVEAKWSHPELIEVVRHALFGGGKANIDGAEKKVETFHANHLISTFVADLSGVDLWKLTASILSATMHGYEPPGEAPGAESPLPASSETTDTADTSTTA